MTVKYYDRNDGINKDIRCINLYHDYAQDVFTVVPVSVDVIPFNIALYDLVDVVDREDDE